MKIKTITKHTSLLGEGPVWDALRKEIYWIDIVNGEIHQYSLKNKRRKTFACHEMIGGIAICKDEKLILATQNGIRFLNRKNGEINRVADPENHLPNNRFNDVKCDPAGRFWAGTMSLSEEFEAGSVYVFDNLSIEKKIEKVTISNGMAWSIDHTLFYYIDTPTFEVAAYEYDKATGNIANKKIAITIPKEDGYPDGMTIDKDGMLWIAHWDGWQVTRWNPETGEKLHTIQLPAARITSCTFGGEDFKDLFITSAKVGLSEAELKAQPLAGSLFVIKNCGFEGLPAFTFNN
jgi:sugar lactone lactonase YvrE